MARELSKGEQLFVAMIAGFLVFAILTLLGCPKEKAGGGGDGHTTGTLASDEPTSGGMITSAPVMIGETYYDPAIARWVVTETGEVVQE